MKSLIPLTPVKSSQLAAVGYNAATKTLAIAFKQKEGTSLPYEYTPVSPEMYAEFQAAESMGKFFGARIKNNKDIKCTKMVPGENEQEPAAA